LEANKEPNDNLDVTNRNFFNNSSNVIFNNDYPENGTANFMLSVWFYIDNWGDAISKEKNILFISNKPNAATVDDLQNMSTGISKKACKAAVETIPYKNLSICLDKYENNLFIDIETYPNSRDQYAMDGSSCFTRYVLQNMPIQKWNNLTLSVDTKTLDVYLDGKLRNSFILHGSYKNKLEDGKKKHIYLGNIGSNINNYGFEGFITRIRFEPKAINPQEAYNIYKDGINASLAKSVFNRYSLKVAFLEYNKEKGAFTI